MRFMFVTDAVFQAPMFWLKVVAPWNMKLMLVTSDTSHAPM